MTFLQWQEKLEIRLSDPGNNCVIRNIRKKKITSLHLCTYLCLLLLGCLCQMFLDSCLENVWMKHYTQMSYSCSGAVVVCHVGILTVL